MNSELVYGNLKLICDIIANRQQQQQQLRTSVIKTQSIQFISIDPENIISISFKCLRKKPGFNSKLSRVLDVTKETLRPTVELILPLFEQVVEYCVALQPSKQIQTSKRNESHLKSNLTMDSEYKRPLRRMFPERRDSGNPITSDIPEKTRRPAKRRISMPSSNLENSLIPAPEYLSK
eukprot:TRINITY_DN73689_c0_g1_i1.p2 TRINITY_DN73689_c0_g1~~TRINITY_DN73689_c0_g1_i1.p2  ORF type:complete len:189 (-),score=5.54 TRINITY_DN73689_c0_g1_i1:259-792(-)